jgi:hypothetical protein
MDGPLKSAGFRLDSEPSIQAHLNKPRGSRSGPRNEKHPPETRSFSHLDPARARLGQHLPVAQPFADGRLVVAALAVGEAVAHGRLGVPHPEQAALILAAQGNSRFLRVEEYVFMSSVPVLL